MPSITYILPDGSRRTLEAAGGTSVMQAAVDAGLPGIVGECGGSAMCATCHVYVEEEPRAGGLPGLSEVEDGMLDSAASERLPTSRLSCQIAISDATDRLVVRMPERQA